MGKYQTGEETKQKILWHSKKLFYHKGYEDTLYNDIAREAKVNRALIPYHFKKKSDLALAVYNDFIKEYESVRNEIAKGYQPEMQLIIGILFFYRLLEEKHVLRFVECVIREEPLSERLFISECIMYESYLKKVTHFSKKKWKLLMHMVCGMDNENIHMIYHNEYDRIQEVGEVMVHLFLEYLGYSPVKVGRVFHQANHILDEYSYHVSDTFRITHVPLI